MLLVDLKPDEINNYFFTVTSLLHNKVDENQHKHNNNVT